MTGQRWWFEWVPGRAQLTLVEEYGTGDPHPVTPPRRPTIDEPTGWLNPTGVTVANPHSDAWRWSEHFLMRRETEVEEKRRKELRQGTLFGGLT